jgi:purine-binding chemotaxis protein CheW
MRGGTGETGGPNGGDAALSRAVELVEVDVDGQRWALPLAAVERVVGMVAVSPLPESPVGVRGVINVHGEIVPVLDLDVRIGRRAREPRPGGRLLLARTARRRVALAVDDVIGVIAVDASAIGPPPDAMPAPVAGLAAVGDGVLLIYAVDAFLSPGDEQAVAAALAGAKR